MNKNLHRIIFNQARGMLIATAETAASYSRGEVRANKNPRRTMRRQTFPLNPNVVAVLLTLSGTVGLAPYAQAQIVGDPNASQNLRPTILNAGNGVPLVNIQTPSAAGVSRNTYSQFDVQSNGVILNNTRNNIQTQLGGWVQGNPNLTGATARVILNEVNSNNPSLLRGFIEVAGDRAQVVVANPSGITCDGCGFINANRATLTTGTPIMSGGNLDGFRVERGQIIIQGVGLEARTTDYTDLIARSVQINAGLWANALKITAGANQVNSDNSLATPIPGIGTPPNFAIDVAQLGGMYAGKITLIGNETGVGVRNAGQIGASAGEVAISANGLLTNSGQINSSASMRIESEGGIVNSGTLYAQGDNLIHTQGELTNSGLIAAQNNLTLQTAKAARIVSGAGSALIAGLNADGNLGQTGNLTLSAAGSASLSGQVLAAGDATLSAASLDLGTSRIAAANLGITASTGNIDTRQAVISTPGILRLTANTNLGQWLDNSQGSLSAAQLEIAVANLRNHAGNILQTSSADLTITLPSILDNSTGRIATNSRHFSLSAATLDNSAGKIDHVGSGLLTLNATTFNDQQGQITSNGDLSLNAATLDHRAASTLARQITVNAGALDNTAGEILNTGNTTLTINTSGLLDNTAGKIASNGSLAMTANQLNNIRGKINASLNLTLSTVGTLDNSDGFLFAEHQFSLTGNTLNNLRGNLQSGSGNATLNLVNLNNEAGTLYSGGNLALTATHLSNTHLIAARGNATLSTQTLDSSTGSQIGAGIQADGTLSGSANLTLNASQTLVAHGQVLAAGDATLSAASLDLSASRIAAANLDLTAGIGNIDTRQAVISTPGSLRLTANANPAQWLDNTQGSLSAGQFVINTSNLRNQAGDILQTGNADLAIALPGILNNSTGRIATNSRHFSLSAATLDNSAGKIDHVGSGLLTLNATTFNDQQGQITSNGDLSLNAGTLDHRAASTLARQITVNVGTLDNTAGEILNTGNTTLTINTSGLLDNTAGKIASNGNLAMTANNLLNQGGLIQVAGNTSSLELNVDNTLDNSAQGQIIAGGNATLGTTSLDNRQGQITANGSLIAHATDTLDNRAGLIAANGPVTLGATTLDNTGGTLASVTSHLRATSSGQTLNNSGQIQAALDLTLNNTGLSNTSAPGVVSAGQINGRQLSIDSHGQALDNTGGTLAATQTVTLSSGQLNNQGGLIQSGGTLAIDTSGHTLNNTETATSGGLVAQGAMTLSSGRLDSRAGFIGAGGPLNATSSELINTNGASLLAQSSATLTGSSLDNQGGQIQALGNLTIDMTGGSLNNRSSLIRSAQTLILNAAVLDNTATQSANQGIEGADLSLTASQVYNDHGALRATRDLTLNATTTVDNQSGLFSAGRHLTLQDLAPVKSLALTNTGGRLIADSNTNLNLANLTGDGQISAGNDLGLQFSGDFTNATPLIAGRHVNLQANGKLTNNSILQAGHTLTLNLGDLDNTASGEIAASNTLIQVGNTLTNRGLIDGSETQINAAVLNNLGSGRLYGDHLAIAANTLNNTPESGNAPVIAARSRLDLAVGALDNREHALIYSDGDLVIGGTLDSNGFAFGQAGNLTNASATIEAMGNLSINATNLSNTNLHYSTQNVLVSTTSIDEFQGEGALYRYPRSDAYTQNVRDSFYRWIIHGSGYDRSYEFIYTHNVTETQELTSDPAKLLAGGSINLNIASALNDKSQIIAGGALNLSGGSLINSTVAGQRITTDSGTIRHYIDHQPGGSNNDWTEIQYGAYSPAPVIAAITISPSLSLAYTAPNISGTTLGNLGPLGNISAHSSSTGATSAVLRNLDLANSGVTPLTPGNTGSRTPAAILPPSDPGTLAPASTSQPALPPGSAAPGAITTPNLPPLTLPNNALYRQHPEPGSRYLVETDPRFASYRTWLSSDYMLQQLSLDPTLAQKRLGDGFYEQKLLREQISELTGRRFLEGYASDEAEYRALMGAGVSFAQTHALRPGIALSAAQVAQLTSDLVWLVAREVRLADGSTQQVLVPQVYLMPRSGDLATSGALLSGAAVNVNLSGNFTNSGTLAGRDLVALNAENIQNLGGRISGASVSLAARNDLENLGGRIEAISSLNLQAGRDLNIASTTSTQSNAQGSRTTIARLAGLYVSGLGGTLTAVAGRDANFTAAEVVNAGSGPTTLAAGNNLNFGVVTESLMQRNVWDSRNYRSENTRVDLGSRVRAGGDLTLLAGNDLSAKALDMVAQGKATLSAGNDLLITAGQRTQVLDEASFSQSKSKGFGGLGGSTRRASAAYQVEQSEVVSSTLSGQNLSLQAGRDVTLAAATLTAQDKLALTAGRDLTVSTAESYVVRHEQQQVTKKENVGPGQQSLKTTRDEITVTPEVSQLSARDITLQSGRDLSLVAPQIKADTLTATAGGQLTVAAATATYELKETSEFKTNRFNFSEVTNPSVTGARIKDKIKLTQAQGERQAVVADLEVQSIALNSGGDTVLLAPRIRAASLAVNAGTVNGETVNPAAQIQLLGVKESVSVSSSKNSHSFVHETVRDGGMSAESLKLPDIRLSETANVAVDGVNRPISASPLTPQSSPTQSATPSTTQLALAAPGGLVVGAASLAPTQREMLAAGTASGTANGASGKAPNSTPYDLRGQAETLAKQPGLAWLGEVAKRQDVDWQKIALTTEQWDYKRAGLTSEGAAIVVIVVTALTWGAGSGLGAGVAEGAGMTTAAGSAGASGTLVAGTGGTVALTTGGAMVASGVAAGVTTLASQAAVSLINHQGDVGKTLKDLGSQENVKALVTSMLSAGLAQGATSALQGVKLIGNPLSDPSFGTRFANYAVKAGVAAGVQSAVYGTPLSETAKTALINSLAQSLTSQIGDWGKGSETLVAKTIAHAVVQCAAASIQNKDCGSAALGAAVAEALSTTLDKLDDRTKAAGYQQTLGSSIAGMSAMLVAGLTGKDAFTALNSAQMVDFYNRQLHPMEQQRAKELATKSNGKFTEQEVADGLRWADNSKLGETAQSNTVIDKTSDAALGNKPNDPIASSAFDPMIPGKMTAANQPYTSNGSGVLVQNLDQVAKPSSELMAYIQQNTGGANSPYRWNSTAWQASPQPSYDNTRYISVSADGKTFSVPLAPCPAAGCTGSDSIAWASTSEKDKASLAAYAVALDQDVKRGAAYIAGSPVMAAGVALGGVPLAGQALTGATIGAGVNYAAQTQLSTDGSINKSEVFMGGITGGLTMGRSMIPTVLINTGGAMNTSAYLNDNIGASIAGTAAGSALGWGMGSLIETVTNRLTGAVAKDTFWQYGKGFSSEFVPKPLEISAPVAKESAWPVIWGATFGAGTQEFIGDAVKNKLKEQP